MFREERRRYLRTKLQWPVTVILSNVQIDGEIQNISQQGAYISFQETPPHKGSLRLVIRPPNREPLKVTAEVIWTIAASSGEGVATYGAGVYFVYISEEDSKFLHNLVREMEESDE